MAGIHRIFLVHFDEPALFVEDFLPEPQDRFFRVNFLQVTSAPTLPTSDFEAVAPPASGEF